MRSPSKSKSGFLHLYFQVHQPRRLGQFSFFDIGTDRDYFDEGLNQLIMRRVADNCYLPANHLLLKLIKKYPGIKITFSISGSALKQLEVFAPDALASFQSLAATGAVEFLSETYYHSLSSLTSKKEFKEQIAKHTAKIEKLFGVTPAVFRNTELIYNNEMGSTVSALGYKGMITDGVERILGDRSPNHLYQHPDKAIRIFLRNYRLSDDIAFRFAQKDWTEFPLTPEKYVKWLEAAVEKEEIITLGLDYETFGEHQKAETGIFNFLESLLIKLAKHKRIKMISPSQAIEQLQPVGRLKMNETISWADESKNLTAWLGNDIQQDAFENLSKMEMDIKNTGNRLLLNAWRYLQTSDHFYYMATKAGNDGGVHHYFSPYHSPYEAFMNYMNILSDLSLKLEKKNYPEEKWPIDKIYHKLNGMDSHWKPESLTF